MQIGDAAAGEGIDDKPLSVPVANNRGHAVLLQRRRNLLGRRDRVKRRTYRNETIQHRNTVRAQGERWRRCSRLQFQNSGPQRRDRSTPGTGGRTATPKSTPASISSRSSHVDRSSRHSAHELGLRQSRVAFHRVINNSIRKRRIQHLRRRTDHQHVVIRLAKMVAPFAVKQTRPPVRAEIPTSIEPSIVAMPGTIAL